MVTTRPRLLDLDAFLQLPEEKPELELIDGEVCQKPVGKKSHSRAQFNLGFLLKTHPATRAGQPYTELGMHWWWRGDHRNHRVPDLSYFRADRDFESDYPDEPPDLVAEVVSPGQSRRELRERLAFLREHGVPATLLIDPERQAVEATEGGRTWTATAGERVELATLDGFGFDVSQLFA